MIIWMFLLNSSEFMRDHLISHRIYEKFIKRGPPELFGSKDPLVADDWIIQMEKIFRVFECSGR